jgi:hypothetical protein
MQQSVDSGINVILIRVTRFYFFYKLNFVHSVIKLLCIHYAIDISRIGREMDAIQVFYNLRFFALWQNLIILRLLFLTFFYN